MMQLSSTSKDSTLIDNGASPFLCESAYVCRGDELEKTFNSWVFTLIESCKASSDVSAQED